MAAADAKELSWIDGTNVQPLPAMIVSMQFDDMCIPDWTFDLEEISNGVFRLSGRHTLGPSVEANGTEIDQLQREVLKSVKELNAEITRHRAEQLSRRPMNRRIV